MFSLTSKRLNGLAVMAMHHDRLTKQATKDLIVQFMDTKGRKLII